MLLNQYGKIVAKQWLWLREQYDYLRLDRFIIMPNHIHGVLIICRDRSRPVPTKSLSQIIGAFKTTSSKLIHQKGLKKFNWQRSFYDHIIRNEDTLNKIREYIQYNPLKWVMDRDNSVFL